jgi:phospholipid transport system substrate-binding protein
MRFSNLLFALTASMLLVSAARAQAPASTPDAMVRDLSNEVLNAIKADKALKSGDANRVQKLVDDKVLPYTDFQKMTQLSVGPGWRNATPEQRAALTREFRMLLVRTYSGALSQISDHKVELRPFRAQPTDTDVIVRTQVVASRGDPIQLDYRLEKTDGGWKIYDINILGVWLIENYKSQFSSQVNSSGIDGLIKTLSERNSQLAQKKA